MLTSEASSVEASPSYDAIAQALTETERGRWFLAEYVRRQRHADLQSLIDALSRLQGAVPGAGQTAENDRDRLRFRLVQIQRLIERTRVEIALAPGSQPTLDGEAGADPLTALARAQDKTTAAIIDAAELIQEMAWTKEPPRTMGGDVTDHGVRERLAGLYAVAANSMAISERFRLLARLVDQIEGRLAKAVEICDVPAKPEPAPRRDEASAANVPQPVRLVVDNAGQPVTEPSVMHSAASIREQLQALVARQAAAPQPPERNKTVRSAGEVLAGLTALTAAEKLHRFT